MIIGGIDPGKAGALAFIEYFNIKTPRIIGLHACPIVNDEMDCHQILAILADYHPTHIGIERSQAMRKQGVTQGVVSMFNYGMNFGMYMGLLIAAKIPFTKIYPQVWKREYNLLKQPKEASIARAKELFPFDAGLFKFKKDHGKADACLLADYAKRKIWGRVNTFKPNSIIYLGS